MSVQNPDLQPIIIKKKVISGGHHGGAWKVAYADFVTAMMALFIVLWLLSSSSKVKEAVAGYFSDPTGSGKMMGSAAAGSGAGLALTRDDMNNLKDKLQEAVKNMPELAKMKDQVAMTVTGEGLRIELLETDVGTFFESGNAKPSTGGTEMLNMLATQLGKLPNRIFIEGHTDARPFNNDNGYTNWELSADRANSARRLMQQNGMRADQVAEVRGFADQRLRDAKNPEAASNRRVTIIVKYNEAPAAPAAEGGKEAKPAEGHGAPAGHGAAPAAAPPKPSPTGGHGGH
jgi:chemotaxis protein MotB